MENNINVAIVDNDVNYRKLYMECVKSLGVENLFSTAHPMRSLDFIVVNHPKVLIMDIVLPGYDSFEYIRTVRELSPDTNIIVITHLVNACIEKMCADLGVVKYIHKTEHADNIYFVIYQYIGLEYIRENYHNVLNYAEERNDDLIDEILQNLHLPYHIKGTQYTKIAVKDMLKRNMSLDSVSITKDIYPVVAKACDTTVSKVERSIRYCIEFILENGTMELISPEKYGVTIKGNYKLSNSKFLMILANHVLHQLNSSDKSDDI